MGQENKMIVRNNDDENLPIQIQSELLQMVEVSAYMKG